MLDNTGLSITVSHEDEYVVIIVSSDEYLGEPNTYVFSIDEAQEFSQMLEESIIKAKENA